MARRRTGRGTRASTTLRTTKEYGGRGRIPSRGWRLKSAMPWTKRPPRRSPISLPRTRTRSGISRSPGSWWLLAMRREASSLCQREEKGRRKEKERAKESRPRSSPPWGKAKVALLLLQVPDRRSQGAPPTPDALSAARRVTTIVSAPRGPLEPRATVARDLRHPTW